MKGIIEIYDYRNLPRDTIGHLQIAVGKRWMAQAASPAIWCLSYQGFDPLAFNIKYTATMSKWRPSKQGGTIPNDRLSLTLGSIRKKRGVVVRSRDEVSVAKRAGDSVTPWRCRSWEPVPGFQWEASEWRFGWWMTVTRNDKVRYTPTYVAYQ